MSVIGNLKVVSIGIDPGPTSGIAVLGYKEFRDVIPAMVAAFQCNAEALEGLLEYIRQAYAPSSPDGKAYVQWERFVAGNRAGSKGKNAELTRAAVRTCELAFLDAGYAPAWHSAAEVKPWATNRRLERAGILVRTEKMRDARDGGRHALFRAVHSGAARDPLT